MSVCCLCDELITRPEESYRLWCVVVCDLETSWMRKLWPTGGGGAVAPKEKSIYIYVTDLINVREMEHIKILLLLLVHPSIFPNKIQCIYRITSRLTCVSISPSFLLRCRMVYECSDVSGERTASLFTLKMEAVCFSETSELHEIEAKRRP